MSKQISIIIPSWFSEEQHGKYGKHETYWFAVECIIRLFNATNREEIEIIIIDNGSTITDESAVSITGVKPELYWGLADILIRNKTNLGFAPSCNQGFALAKGEYVVCINNDILVWEGWDDALIELLNTDLNPKPGLVMPALMKETRDARESLKYKKEDLNLKTNHDKVGLKAEFGSLWMCRKSLLDELIKTDGYIFDENFKLGMGEDRDLYDRVRLLGYETYRSHKTRVFHQGNMTIGKVKNRKDYTTKNREYLAEKRKKRNLTA